MYISLSDLVEQFQHNANIRFREEVVSGRRVTIVCYMVADDALWAEDLGTETRGACFDSETGELLSLPFEKFFNLNEKEFTQKSVIDELIRENEVIACDKLDGSMISPILVDGKVYLKTKKSFSSDVANLAQQHVHLIEDLCKRMIQQGWSPLFEFTAPDNKVVIAYGEEPRFTLLAARSMTDGTYMSIPALEWNANEFNIPIPNWEFVDGPIDDLIELSAECEGIEGWVLYIGGVTRIKIKTKWYLDRHRMLDVRERDVARFVLEDVLDDLIPDMIAGEVDMDIVKCIESRISSDLTGLRETIDKAIESAKDVPDGASRAEFIKMNYADIAAFVFRGSRGDDVDDSRIKDWYKKKYLHTFSLRSIGNPLFSKEVDDAVLA